jgi:ribosomal protein S18 acetylase RimI-like enzyme
MPKVRRAGLPPALLRHLLQRIQERSVGPEQLTLLAAWLDTEPEVPAGRWFKRFPGMTVCGEGELVRTFLTPEQAPTGTPLL